MTRIVDLSHRCFAVPPRIDRMATLPVRAFAILDDAAR
jgi:hypothetical protein